MSLSGDTPRENLTLTEADLAACRPIVGEGGHVLRALCPFHGSDRQRSLRVQVHSGRFVCFACGAWGYMAEARERWREEQQRQAHARRPPARQRQPPRLQPTSPPALGVQPPPVHTWHVQWYRVILRQRGRTWRQQLAAFQAALPGSRGETYLQQRGIPLALAQQLRRGLCGAGHLAARRPRLARRPCGLSAYHAGRAPGEPLRPGGRYCRAGAEGEAA